MQDAISGLTSEMRWRVRSILQTQRYHTANAIQLYKPKILYHCEHRTVAIYNDCASSLQRVDCVQDSCLEELCIDDVTAFSVFNLAPLLLRGHLAMIGIGCISRDDSSEKKPDTGKARAEKLTNLEFMNVKMGSN